MDAVMKDTNRLRREFPVRIPIPTLPTRLVKPMAEINMADSSNEKPMRVAFRGRNRKGTVSERPIIRFVRVKDIEWGDRKNALSQTDFFISIIIVWFSEKNFNDTPDDTSLTKTFTVL